MRIWTLRAALCLLLALVAFACEKGPTAPSRTNDLPVVQAPIANSATLFSNGALSESDRAEDQCASRPPINRGPPRLILRTEANNGLTVTWDYPRTEERPAYWCLSYRAPIGSGTIDFPGDMMSASANGLPPGNYFFTICPGYDGGVGDCTSDSLTIASQTSNPARNLRYVQNGKSVTLSWDPPSCCLNSVPPTTYVLVVNGQAQVLGLVTETTLTTLPPGPYTVTVVARNAAGDSAPSNAVSFTIPSCTGAPAVPQVGVAVKGTYVALLWSRSPDDLDRLETYDIELAGTIVVSRLPVASVDGNLNPGVYMIRIRAVNACGSTWSDVVRVVVESTAPPPPQPPPPSGAAVSNVRIYLTGCSGSADPLPGWRNCTGRVTMDVDADIRTGWIQVVFAFPTAGSFYQGAVQVTPGRIRGNVSVDVKNGYVSSCPSTYASSIGVSDGRQGIDTGFTRFASVPITLHCE
jgi:hypothetical protein